MRAGDRTFEGPAAIVTVPLGVLKFEAISFDPPLPDGHAHAISALGFGVLSKTYFRFDRRTWTAENASTSSSAPNRICGRGGRPAGRRRADCGGVQRR